MNSLKEVQEFTFNISCKHEVVLYLAKSHNNLACTSLGKELLFYFFLGILFITNGQKQNTIFSGLICIYSTFDNEIQQDLIGEK